MGLVVAVAVGTSSRADDAINGFDLVRATFSNGQSLPGWTTLLAGERRAVLETVPFAFDAAERESGRPGFVLYFDPISDGFGDQRIDQCIVFDASEPLEWTLRLRHDAAPVNDNLRIRVNPNFYASLEDCRADVAQGRTDHRLSGTNFNNDYDVRFAAAALAPNRWHDVNAATHGTSGPFRITAFPTGAEVVRFSVRARAPTATQRIWFGPIELRQGANPLAVENGDLQAALRSRNQAFIEPAGATTSWAIPDRAAQQPLRIRAIADALSRPNVVEFRDLTDGFGDNRIDRCIPLVPGRDATPSVFARSPTPQDQLAIRLNLSYHSTADCTGPSIETLDSQDDRPVNGDADTWLVIEGTRRDAAELDAEEARGVLFSLRARDRSSNADTVLWVDSVSLNQSLAWSVPPGVFDAPITLTVNDIPEGLIARYTTDGTPPSATDPEFPADGLLLRSTTTVSIRLFDADGEPRSGTQTGTFVISVANAPRIDGLAENFIGLEQAFSSVVGDAHHFWATEGFRFELSSPIDPTPDLELTIESANPAVLDATQDVDIERIGNAIRVTVQPRGVGFSNLTLRVRDDQQRETTEIIAFAALQPTAANADTRFFSGRADASAVVPLGDGQVLVFDDEGDFRQTPRLTNAIQLHDISRSSPPRFRLDVDAALDLFDSSHCSDSRATGVAGCNVDGEVDYEATTRLGDRIFVTGSHSNNGNGRTRPDRWRFFAMDLTESTAPDQPPQLDVIGFYRWLREDLRLWDATDSHGLTPDYFGLVASSNGGDPDVRQAPENPNRSGFSIEGLTLAPNDAAAWFGFRAPLVAAPGEPAVQPNDVTGRTHALIIPVLNYQALATADDGGEPGQANFGTPIRLDLGGRGIRSLERLDDGNYVILAGPSASATGVAPLDFRLFTWSGLTESDGRAIELYERPVSLAGFTPPNFAASPEAFARLPASLAAGGEIDIVSDSGDVVFYGDGVEAKRLPFEGHKNFRIDRVELPGIIAGQCGPAANSTIPPDTSVDACASGEWQPDVNDPRRWVCLGEGTRDSICVNQDPPAQDPPAQDPPAQDPPAQDPPAQDPPAQDPPAQDPPAQDPPAQDPPAQDPPAQDPPAQDPPAQDPPAQDPPAQDPPPSAGSEFTFGPLPDDAPIGNLDRPAPGESRCSICVPTNDGSRGRRTSIDSDTEIQLSVTNGVQVDFADRRNGASIGGIKLNPSSDSGSTALGYAVDTVDSGLLIVIAAPESQDPSLMTIEIAADGFRVSRIGSDGVASTILFPLTVNVELRYTDRGELELVITQDNRAIGTLRLTLDGRLFGQLRTSAGTEFRLSDPDLGLPAGTRGRLNTHTDPDTLEFDVPNTREVRF
ncbi:MAG: chitobiase/beta-hexosaminidase C-terminal domain-containing protein [Thioalkalivibrionaceae bacterium]